MQSRSSLSSRPGQPTAPALQEKTAGKWWEVGGVNTRVRRLVGGGVTRGRSVSGSFSGDWRLGGGVIRPGRSIRGRFWRAKQAVEQVRRPGQVLSLEGVYVLARPGMAHGKALVYVYGAFRCKLFEAVKGNLGCCTCVWWAQTF